jgi:hypothetical protein
VPVAVEYVAAMSSMNGRLHHRRCPRGAKTSTVEECGAAFVKGIEGRKRGVFYPRWVALTPV